MSLLSLLLMKIKFFQVLRSQGLQVKDCFVQDSRADSETRVENDPKRFTNRVWYTEKAVQKQANKSKRGQATTGFGVGQVKVRYMVRRSEIRQNIQ